MFAAPALTSLLLGSFGLALGSGALGHARVVRRCTHPGRGLDVVRSVTGVEASAADRVFQVV
ncbi:hypothetical protein GCM10010431_57070 [Streptomyces kunmingensis]